MNIVTPVSMRAAYKFLREVSFSGVKLPPPSKVRFRAKKLKKYHGIYEYPQHVVTINTETTSITQLLQIMAHEMIHVALEQNAVSDHSEHDSNFKSLAGIIEFEMGWPRGSV